MRRSLVAIVAAAACTAATAWSLPERSQPSGAPRVAYEGAGSRGDVAATAVPLGRLGAIAAGQAQTLLREIRACGRPAPSGRCLVLALGHASAGAKMNGVILAAARPGLEAQRCRRALDRLGAMMATIAYLGVDAAHSGPWPAEVRADARAAAVVARRMGGVAAAAGRLRRCARGLAWLRPGLVA
jgi:hypothetical protein